jgi:polysaccharide deacetylase family protein (PEP-CTERM system associated)
VGSHGYYHYLVYKQTPTEFEADLKKSLDIIEGITGEKVLGYRAPSSSITPESIWALEILRKHGLKYDASVLPVKRSYAGMPDAPKYLYPILTNSTTRLMEFPVSTVRIFGRDIPFAGGGYFRLIPYPIIKKWIKKADAAGKPIIAYFHPWEIDSHPPKYKVSLMTHIKYGYSHYVNLSKTEQKLKLLLNDFSFAPVKEILALTF